MSSVLDDAQYRPYTVDEACKFLRCEKEWLYDACQRGRISHLKRGNRTLFLRRHLIEYVESIEVKAAGHAKGGQGSGRLSVSG